MPAKLDMGELRRLLREEGARPLHVPLISPARRIPTFHTEVSIPASRELHQKLEDYGNRLSEAHALALRMLCGTFSEMAFGRRRGRYAFGLPTGCGKTTAVAVWCANLIRSGHQKSVAISASKVEALCELRREFQALGVPADRVGLLHSKQYAAAKVEAVLRGDQISETHASEPSEGHDRQILLITHQRARSGSSDSPYRWRDKPRDLIIWDESLITSDSTGLDISDIRAATAWLEARYGDSEKYRDALAWSKEAAKAITGALDKPGKRKVDTIIRLPELEEGDRPLLPHKGVVNPLRDLLDIAGHPLRVVGNAGSTGGAVWFQVAVPPELDNILILDASTPIRQLVRHDSTIIDVEDPERGLPQVRRVGCTLGALKDFSDVTISHMDAGGGRSTMSDRFNHVRREDRKVSRAVVDVVRDIPEDEGVLIFVYKTRPGEPDFRRILLMDLNEAGVDAEATTQGRARLNVLTWGQETSLNAFGHCSNVILVGVLQRSEQDLAGAYVGQRGDLETEVTRSTIKSIQQSESAHLVYQALSRGSCRFINDGQARPMKAWIIHDGVEVKEDLEKVMPGAVWRDWHIEGVSHPRKIAKLAERIKGHLETLPESIDKVSVRQLKADLDIAAMPAETVRLARLAALGEPLGWRIDRRSFVRQRAEDYGFRA